MLNDSGYSKGTSDGRNDSAYCLLLIKNKMDFGKNTIFRVMIRLLISPHFEHLDLIIFLPK